MIQKRIRGLGPDCAEVLDVASVFGAKFHGDWLAFGRSGSERSLVGLEQAVLANLLRPVAGESGTYEFVHGLIRDALYEELGESRRATLHQSAATFFETYAGLDEERRLSALAYHHLRALPLGDAELALSYAIRAGTQAQARYAYEVAADHFSQALGILESGAVADEEQYFAVLLDLGHALMQAGQRDAARAALDRAAELARRLGLADGLARVALRVAPSISVVDMIADEDEVRLLEEAVEALQEDDAELTALLKARLAVSLTMNMSWEQKLTLLEEAERLIGNTPNDDAKARLLCSRLAALWRPDNLKDRIAWADAAVVPCQRTRDYGLIGGLSIFRFTLALEQGDTEAAGAASDALTRACIEGAQPKFFGDGYKGVLAFVTGRLPEAEQACASILRIAERTKLHSPLQGFGALFSLIRIEQGRAEEVLEMLQFFGNEYKEMPGWRALIAFALTKAEKLDDARREFDRLAEQDFPIPRDSTWLGCMAMLAEVCAVVDGQAPTCFMIASPRLRTGTQPQEPGRSPSGRWSAFSRCSAWRARSGAHPLRISRQQSIPTLEPVP